MSAASPKIVVVEDEPEVRELELFLLESEGYSVVGVPDGETAAGVVKREAPDLVLLDFLLPHKDGNEVLAELASDPMSANVPVVVITGYTERLKRTPQVRGVLTKPFELPELLDVVAKEVGRQGLPEEETIFH